MHHWGIVTVDSHKHTEDALGLGGARGRGRQGMQPMAAGIGPVQQLAAICLGERLELHRGIDCFSELHERFGNLWDGGLQCYELGMLLRGARGSS